MKNFNLVFYFEGEKHSIKVTAEQLGLNFGLNKILSDLSDGENTFSENNKVLADCCKENKPKEKELMELIEANDIVWENESNGDKYFIVVPSCEDHYIEFYDHDRNYVDMADYYLTLID